MRKDKMADRVEIDFEKLARECRNQGRTLAGVQMILEQAFEKWRRAERAPEPEGRAPIFQCASVAVACSNWKP